jgi:hypothetical protein
VAVAVGVGVGVGAGVGVLFGSPYPLRYCLQQNTPLEARTVVECFLFRKSTHSMSYIRPSKDCIGTSLGQCAVSLSVIRHPVILG